MGTIQLALKVQYINILYVENLTPLVLWFAINFDWWVQTKKESYFGKEGMPHMGPN
jgi:hypothetical protein